jgi:hypothetical protein
MELNAVKDAYRIEHAWRDLALPGEPGKACHSPFPSEHRHGDVHPSFSVFDEGRRWTDFATGESGSVLDLIMKARKSDLSEAIRFVEERLGRPRPVNKAAAANKSRARGVPRLEAGTDDQFRELSERRGFGVDGLRLAAQRGLLHFCNLWDTAAWAVTDKRLQLVEFRRLDGRKWSAYGRLAERKSHCIGSGKCWPIGTLESLPFTKIALLEGAPDLLAAFCCILAEAKEQIVAPVAVLGAANHYLDPTALAHFRGKQICLFPHVDEAGRKAARHWARQMKEAGAARVTAFDLSGLLLVDGTIGKDLADLFKIDADCWEREMKFQEVMP